MLPSKRRRKHVTNSSHLMRVLIINTSEKKGGAAVAASRLTEALNNYGVKAMMMVMEKQTDALYVASTGGGMAGEWHFLWERFVIWANNLFSRRNLFKVSIANSGTDITQTREFREADIVHLHWINQGFLSLKSVRKILASGKPVVWTMHDMWEVTAICHHSYTCDRFQTSCHHCPFLRLPSANDLSARVFRRKQRLFAGAGIHFVAVSNWLADRARRSAVIAGSTVTVIPNAISLSHFKLIDRTDARSFLNIEERYVLCFGAARIDDDIKGLKYLIEALNIIIRRRQLDKADIRLMLFGGIRDEKVLLQIPVNHTYMGYINDHHRLSQLYSASNAVVSSSLYETFGQTLIEAQACGCTPVAFAGSGQADIITHRQNGYLADYLSAESLAEGIYWALTTEIPPAELRKNVCRRYAESVVAQKYVQLYRSLLGRKGDTL